MQSHVAGGSPAPARPSTISSARARRARVAEVEHHAVAQPLDGLPPCAPRCAPRAARRVAARSAAASSPRSSVSRVYPVMSRKQIAGSRSRRLWSPAFASSSRTPRDVGGPARAARVYIASTARSDRGSVGRARSPRPCPRPRSHLATPPAPRFASQQRSMPRRALATELDARSPSHPRRRATCASHRLHHLAVERPVRSLPPTSRRSGAPLVAPRRHRHPLHARRPRADPAPRATAIRARTSPGSDRAPREPSHQSNDRGSTPLARSRRGYQSRVPYPRPIPRSCSQPPGRPRALPSGINPPTPARSRTHITPTQSYTTSPHHPPHTPPNSQLTTTHTPTHPPTPPPTTTPPHTPTPPHTTTLPPSATPPRAPYQPTASFGDAPRRSGRRAGMAPVPAAERSIGGIPHRVPAAR